MRTKIIAGNLIAVLMVGLVSYFIVSEQLEAAFVEEVDSKIARDHRVFERNWRLAGLEYLELTVRLAGEEDSRHPFRGFDESGQRDRAHARANAVATEFDRQNGETGPPEIVAITNSDGIVIARNQSPRGMHGDNLTRDLPSIRGVLTTGEPAIDVWNFTGGQSRPIQTTIAPIRDPSGQILGTLVVGYDISNGIAERGSELLGSEIAFVTEARGVFAHSLEADQAPALRAALFGDEHGAATRAALSGTDAREPWIVTLGDEEYVAVTGTLPLASSTQVAYVVLGNRTAQADKAAPAITILVLMGIGILIVLVYGFVIGTSFLKPIEQLEEGVLAVINGRTDLRLEIESAELGGLAYRINQLLNVFTGTPEEDSDGRVSSPPEADWSGDAGASAPGEAPAAPAAPAAGEEDDPALAARLAEEPEDAYYDRVYDEYVAAKQAIGENVSNIAKDKFVQKLKANEQALLKKHGCRMVRFQVQTRGTQVNLRPVIIR